MSKPYDGHRSFFPFGNPFRMILPKGSQLPPKLATYLNTFEENLAERLKQLKPKDTLDILTLSWMRISLESLSQTHSDIKNLITDLEFPVSDWDDQWMNMYLDNSVKLLDICIAFSSELSRLDQGQLLLQYVRHVLDVSDGLPPQEKCNRAHESLHDWMQQINSKSPKLAICYQILQELSTSLYLTKVKNSPKGKVLMRAMYAVKVETIFVCSVFTAALSCSSKPLMDLPVPSKFLWAEAFNDLQGCVNGEIRRLYSCGKFTILKELEAVSSCVKKLEAVTGGFGCKEAETKQEIDDIEHEEGDAMQIANGLQEIKTRTLTECLSDLEEHATRFSNGLDLVFKQVGDFFQIILSGRDALLSNLRASGGPAENSFR